MVVVKKKKKKKLPPQVASPATTSGGGSTSTSTKKRCPPSYPLYSGRSSKACGNCWKNIKHSYWHRKSINGCYVRYNKDGSRHVWTPSPGDNPRRRPRRGTHRRYR